MGGGCYRIPNRELFFVGGYCPNACFQNHGGCEASAEFEAVKTDVHCEIKPDSQNILTKTTEEIEVFINGAVKQEKTIFLYTPDAFSEFYFDKFFMALSERNGSTYIVINAGVRTLVDRLNNGLSWQDIHNRGIREIWIGVESASPYLRHEYHKPFFTNKEVLDVTQKGQEAGINMCWFLVDGSEDTSRTKARTFELIKRADPYRIHIGELRRYSL